MKKIKDQLFLNIILFNVLICSYNCKYMMYIINTPHNILHYTK